MIGTEQKRERLFVAMAVLLFLAMVWLIPLPAYAQAEESRDPFDVDFQSLSEDIWVVTRPRSVRQPVMGNGLIIINEDHVVVVDANGSPLLADRVIARIKSLTSLPVSHLVITHWHGDHHLGSHRFVEAWPEVEIIAHSFTRKAMLGAPMDYLDETRETLPPQLEKLKGVAATGELPEGVKIPEYMLEDFWDLVAFGELMLLELEDSRVTEPTRTFNQELILNSGRRTIEILNFGKGNTAGDAVIWLPQERILFTGDTVVYPTPYGFHSYPASWVNVLRRFKTLAPGVIVPGHGPVMSDFAYIDQLIELFDYVAASAGAAVTADVDIETFTEQFDWQGYNYLFSENDPILRLRFQQWFETPILEAAYNEAAGIDNEPLVRQAEEEGGDSH